MCLCTTSLTTKTLTLGGRDRDSGADRVKKRLPSKYSSLRELNLVSESLRKIPGNLYRLSSNFFKELVDLVLKTTFRPEFFIFEFYLPSDAGSRTMMVHGSTTVLTLRRE